MLVVRYENDKGEGPYNTRYNFQEELSDELHAQHSERKVNPNWGDDLIEYPETISYYFSGCSSLSDLSKWFKGWNKLLLENEFFIAVYKVPDNLVIHSKSGKQLAFRKNSRVKLLGRFLSRREAHACITSTRDGATEKQTDGEEDATV